MRNMNDMKLYSIYIILFLVPLMACNAQNSEWPPERTEVWEPVPAIVTPGGNNAPPSDAIVLLGGKDLSEWEHMNGDPLKWRLEDGVMTVQKSTGDIRTKRAFGDIQLHIEWRTPEVIESEGQGRGNSGVFLQSLYEVQVLDSYENTTYPNGQAGSIYKQYIPLVNASRGPGKWQTYDIIFSAPVFGSDGSLQKPAYMTVIHNGVLIQNHAEIKGPTVYRGLPEYKSHANKMPIQLQDHGNPVSYRNIWVREL